MSGETRTIAKGVLPIIIPISIGFAPLLLACIIAAIIKDTANLYMVLKNNYCGAQLTLWYTCLDFISATHACSVTDWSVTDWSVAQISVAQITTAFMHPWLMHYVFALSPHATQNGGICA